MATNNILNTRTMDFGELMGNGRVFRVPPYQRDYSWAVEQWEDLWSDLTALGTGDVHYMGAIVIEDSGDRRFAVIDGQQRLATLSILGLAIIGHLKNLADSGIDADRNRERANELRRTFIGEKDPASLLESSKLFLNATDDPFYQDYLVQLREPLNYRSLVSSNRALWDCFVYFQDRVSGLEFRDHGQRVAQFLNEVIARRLLFIVITVDDDVNAYTVFETLNARGLELTTMDLLKNYLFSRVKVQSDLDALQRRWQMVVSTVGANQFATFLRYHLQTSEPRVRSARLFQLVRDRTRSASDVFELLAALESRAELFTALGDPNHSFWIERPGARAYIRELVLFRVKQMTPLLFAAFERLDAPGFERVLKVVSVLLFRYTIVGDRNTNALEPVFQQAAQALMTGSATTPSDVRRMLSSVYVEDANFAADFASMSISTRGQAKRLARYVLAKLEEDASGKPAAQETDTGTIEHVLPENPSAAWSEDFSSDEADRYVYRLGNLTLLESSANREIGNASYLEKVRYYEQSAYRLAFSIAKLAPSEWTPALIERRQSELARRATHVWRVDF